jgi:phosphatidylglycerophosphatase A
MRKAMNHVILFIAQGAFSGRLPKAPGTAGTIVGVLLYILISGLDPFWYGTACAGVIAFGTWTAGRADAILGTKDNPSIVIDEIAGYLVALAFLPVMWWTVIAGFVLFRIFDILKPWPLYRIQRIPGGAGVMVDDIGAGIYTNVLLHIAAYLVNRG